VRTAGLILLLAAGLIALSDAVAANWDAAAFAFRPVGALWFALDRASLLFMDNLISRHVSQLLWERIWVPLMGLPAAPAAALAGLLLLLAARLRRRGR